MEEAAYGIAVRAGEFNQTGCSNTRIVYVECGTDEEDLERLERFGHAVHKAFGELPAWFSTAPKRPDPELDADLDAVALDEEFYRVIGNTSFGGAVVSRTEEAVEFASRLNNRIVNIVPVSDITRVGDWVHGDETSTIGVYPESLREQIRNDLASYGAQGIKPLKREGRSVGSGAAPEGAEAAKHALHIHDGHEPLRRMVRWVTDESLGLQ
jgi:hypothetical protein